MMEFLYIGIAGFLGALSRVSLGQLLNNIYPNNIFPYPTLVINILGSFLLSFFLVYTGHTFFSEKIRKAISTGFLGSFTTFSTFSVETLRLFNIQAFNMAFLYITFSFVGGIFASLIGFQLAQTLLKGTNDKVRGN